MRNARTHASRKPWSATTNLDGCEPCCMCLQRLTLLLLKGVQLHEPLGQLRPAQTWRSSYLIISTLACHACFSLPLRGTSRDADEHRPLQVRGRLVRYDLGPGQVRRAVEYLSGGVPRTLRTGRAGQSNEGVGGSQALHLPLRTSTSQWYTDVAVTKPSIEGLIHFQNSTVSGIWYALSCGSKQQQGPNPVTCEVNSGRWFTGVVHLRLGVQVEHLQVVPWGACRCCLESDNLLVQAHQCRVRADLAPGGV